MNHAKGRHVAGVNQRCGQGISSNNELLFVLGLLFRPLRKLVLQQRTAVTGCIERAQALGRHPTAPCLDKIASSSGHDQSACLHMQHLQHMQQACFCFTA